MISRVFIITTAVRGKYILARSVAQIVFVLNRHDGCDGARDFELRNTNVRNADMTNFTRLLQIGQCSD